MCTFAKKVRQKHKTNLFGVLPELVNLSIDQLRHTAKFRH